MLAFLKVGTERVILRRSGPRLQRRAAFHPIIDSRLTVATPDPQGYRLQVHASGCSDVPRRQPEMAPVSGAAVPRSRGSNDPPPGRDVPQKPDVRGSTGSLRGGEGSGPGWPRGVSESISLSGPEGFAAGGPRSSPGPGTQPSIQSEVRSTPYNATSGTTGRRLGPDPPGGVGVLNPPYWS